MRKGFATIRRRTVVGASQAEHARWGEVEAAFAEFSELNR